MPLIRSPVDWQLLCCFVLLFHTLLLLFLWLQNLTMPNTLTGHVCCLSCDNKEREAVTKHGHSLRQQPTAIPIRHPSPYTHTQPPTHSLTKQLENAAQRQRNPHIACAAGFKKKIQKCLSHNGSQRRGEATTMSVSSSPFYVKYVSSISLLSVCIV